MHIERLLGEVRDGGSRVEEEEVRGGGRDVRLGEAAGGAGRWPRRGF